MIRAEPGRHWLDALGGCPGPCVTVTLAGVEGSVPREAGARMLVTGSEVDGTIGGGHLEFKAITLARAMLEDAASPSSAIHRFALGPSLGQCCGGAATLILERLDPVNEAWIAEAARRRAGGEVLVLATVVAIDSGARLRTSSLSPDISAEALSRLSAGRLIGRRQAGCAAGIDTVPAALREPARVLIESPVESALLVTLPGAAVLLERIAPEGFHVMLFGAGHVGQAIVSALGLLPCTATWIDGRESQFPSVVPPNVEILSSSAPALEVHKAPPGSFFLVVTHSHALDQDICEEVLRREDFDYLGLIGSATKRAMFERRLVQRGIPKEHLARMTCPIGIPGISGKLPSVIAVAVVAQLLQMHEALRAGAPRRLESRTGIPA